MIPRLGVLFSVLGVFVASGGVHAAEVDFAEAVEPILKKHCLECHNPQARKSGLDLSSATGAMQGGDSGTAAFVGGNVAGSIALQMITSADLNTRMPPKGDGLSTEEIATLTAWIEGGAQWGEGSGNTGRVESDHWAFQAPEQAPLPEVGDTAWGSHPIDRFVYAGLQAVGLNPTKRADKETLLRRVYLDLVGLPPSPAEVEAFLADASPDAYARVVESLLASPHYGEKQAIAWLDIARYADSNGYEKDRHRSIWPYRDWVIDALNQDMPYDTFVLKQLAGDMLQHATEADHVATGFLRNSLYNEEGGIDVEEFRFEAMVDRVNTVGAGMLGLTMNCAQCHSHKSDPITQREYYSFYAFLNNTENVETKIRDPKIFQARAGVQAKIDAIAADLANRFPVGAKQYRDVLLQPGSIETASAAQGTPLQDQSVLISGAAADKDAYTVVYPVGAKRLSGLKLTALPHDSLGSNGPGRADNGNFVLTGIEVLARNGAGKERALKVGRAEADFEQKKYPVAKVLDGKDNSGWGIWMEEGDSNVARKATFHFAEEAVLADGEQLVVKLKCNLGGKHTLGRFQVQAMESYFEASELPEAERRAEYLAERLATWESEQAAKAKRWHIQEMLSLTPKKKTTLKKLDDNSILAMGEFPNNDTYTVTFRSNLKGITGLRLELLPHETLPGGGPGRGMIMSPDGDFFLSETRLKVGSWAAREASETVTLADPSASFAAGGRDIKLTLDGKSDTGWGVNGKQGEAVYATYRFEEPVAGFDGGSFFSLELEQLFIHQHTIGRFRVSLTTDDGDIVATGLPHELEEALLEEREAGGEAMNAALRAYYLGVAPELAASHGEIATLEKSKPSYVTTLSLQERETQRPTLYRHRGEFLSPKFEVTAATPSVLHPFPEHWTRNRLNFARWITAEENPLFARVHVNRVWQRVFGVGLVETTEDFGILGTVPSNQALLDWLSVEFMARGWSTKELLRMIVTSEAYQQASQATAAHLELDPKNQLLSRGPRFRMDGEVIRDVALASSGLLSTKMGGPSVYPPLSKDLMSIVYGGGGGWPTSEGEDRYRRGVYTYIKRMLPYPSMTVFGAPSREQLCARRVKSNTPLQALTVLNNSEFMVAAQALARRVLTEADGDRDAQITYAYRCVLGRNPDATEVAWVRSFLEEQEVALGKRKIQGKKLVGETLDGVTLGEQSAWVALSRVLLNLDESLSKG